MNKAEILEFVAKNPIFALATTDGHEPRVRMMMLHRADDGGLIFSTGANKEVHRQMLENPQVEMCFYSGGDGKQVRVTGRVELLDDMKLKKQIVEAFPFLKLWVEKEGYEALAPWCMRHGRATVWTMETESAPKEWVDI